jgi:hypothetical protein
LQKKRLAKLKRRRAELETLFKRIYEDYALGKLSTKRYHSLSAEYEQEQEKIDREIPALDAEVFCFEDGAGRADRFTELVSRYEDFDELATPMINEFVEKIVVHERDRKGSADTTQGVDIHFNFIGTFVIPKEEKDPAALAAEEAKRRALDELKDRRHEQYLKRKASGKVKEYERRYSARRKARYAEKKAAAYAAVYAHLDE